MKSVNLPLSSLFSQQYIRDRWWIYCYSCQTNVCVPTASVGQHVSAFGSNPPGWLCLGGSPLSVPKMAQPWRSNQQYLWAHQRNQGGGHDPRWTNHSAWRVSGWSYAHRALWKIDTHLPHRSPANLAGAILSGWRQWFLKHPHLTNNHSTTFPWNVSSCVSSCLKPMAADVAKRVSLLHKCPASRCIQDMPQDAFSRVYKWISCQQSN